MFKINQEEFCVNREVTSSPALFRDNQPPADHKAFECESVTRPSNKTKSRSRHLPLRRFSHVPAVKASNIQLLPILNQSRSP
jgi:hypothetical protein